MIPKIHLKELWRITMRRSTLITIPKLQTFFEFNNKFSHWEVFYGIVRDALDKYHYYFPLYRVQKTYLTVDNNMMAWVEDNFADYLKGILDESQIFLMPGSVLGLGYYGNVGTSFPLRNFKYEGGQFTDFLYPSGPWYMACLCHYPFPEDIDEKGEPGPNCNVYWVNKDETTRFKVFKDQIYVELCRYIWNMKQNFNLPNLPIDLFTGLQEDSQRVQSDLDQIYEQALRGSAWLI